MKVYEFPYGGSGGKGDSWDAIIDVKLTDEESERLIASAEAHYDMGEDPKIHDIYQKVYRKIVDQNVESMEWMLDELRSEYGMRKNAAPRKVVDEYLGDQCIHILYPEVIIMENPAESGD